MESGGSHDSFDAVADDAGRPVPCVVWVAVALVAGVSTGLALAVPAVPMTLGAIGVSIIAQLVRPIPRVRFLLFLMVVAMVGALHASMRAIQREGRGAIVYLRPSGSGGEDGDWRKRLITTKDASREAPAAQLPDHQRDFGVGSQILRALGVRRMRLLTNHPKDLPGLDAFGLEITEHVALDFS